MTTPSPSPFMVPLRRRTYLFGALFLLSLAAIAIFANLISYRHPKRWDLTANKRFTLDPRTIRTLETLADSLPKDGKVHITTCFSSQAASQRGEAIMIGRLEARARQTLTLFGQHSDRIALHFLDPFQNKAEMDQLVARFGGTDLSNTIVVETASKRQFIKRQQLADFDFRSRRVHRWKTETALIQAILSVTGQRSPRFYVTQGTGELSLSRQLNQLKALLEAQNITLLPLKSDVEVPDDADLLLIAAPLGDYSSRHCDQLTRYLDRGGRALVVLPPIGKPRTQLNGLLERYGLRLRRQVVVSKSGDQIRFPLAHTHDQHPITRDISPKQSVEVHMALALEQVQIGPRYRVIPLVTTDKDQARWAHVEDIQSKTRRFQKSTAPYIVSAAASWPVEGRPEGRMVLLGSRMMLEDQHLERAGIANRALIYNSAMWLIDREDQLLRKAHTGREFREINLSDEQKRSFIFLLVMTPLTVFFIGVFVWLFRKD